MYPLHSKTSKASVQQRLRYFPWLLILVVVVSVLWYWSQSIRVHRQSVEQEFSASVNHAVGLIRERFRFYQNIIHSARGLYGSTQSVTDKEWHDFIRALRIAENYPGVESVAFARYENYRPVAQVITALPEEELRGLAAVPAQERGFGALIEHIDPGERVSRMLDYDLASEAETLMAMRRAGMTLQATLTGVMRSSAEGMQLVRQVVPVFRHNLPLETEQQRQAALVGWISVNYNVQGWFDAFAKKLQNRNFTFTIADAGGTVFFRTGIAQNESDFRQQYKVELGGQEWLLNFTSTALFEERRSDPNIHVVPLSALFLVLLLVLMIRWLQGSQQRAMALAESMVEKLRQSEERYREMFEGNRAIELLIDPEDGQIIDANQAAANYYGYSREELKQMNISQINTLTREEVEREMEKAARERRNHFMFKHRHATGEVRDVEVHSGPIEVGGKRLLYSIVHDVTARVESEQALRESEARYHSIIETTSEGYWLIDIASLKIIEVNDALCRMLGYSREEMLGSQPCDFADEDNCRIFTEQAKQVTTRHQRSYEVVLKHRDGHDVIVRINATRMPKREGSPLQTFSFITDVTEWKRTEEQLRIAATFFDTTSEAITVTDANNRIIAVNPAFTLITGYSEEEALGRDPGFLSSGRNDEAFYRNMWQTLERMGRWQGEIWNRRKNGEIYPEWLSIVAIKDESGKVSQYMAVFSDITKRKRDEEKIWRQANYDALTGLPNRNLFKDRLDQAMHAARREHTQLALMFIDLDRFKWVNDTLGHAGGDLLLQQAASRLSEAVRETDTVARFGGDEFTVLLTEIHNPADVDRVAELLLRRLSKPFDLNGKEAYVSGSIGITMYPDDADNLEQLLSNADAAMYTAKAAGRNAYRYFTQSMNEDAQRRLKLEADLRKVLEREELSLHYQPIVDGQGRIAGAEALLRWEHPFFGNVDPDEFIPLAEEVGMIVPIEQWVMSRACVDAVQFQQRSHQHFFMSVNISSVQCKSEQCQSLIGSVLEESGLSPACLKLEITERVMMDNTEHVIDLLAQVKAMGVRLAVDDFGTGYSSLSYLKQFPVDVLKIDRTFIAGLPADKDDVALVEAIVAMAHSLNLQVIAEGVETDEQLAFLHSLGCDMVQGFFYSHALPFDDFMDYLRHY